MRKFNNNAYMIKQHQQETGEAGFLFLAVDSNEHLHAGY